MTKVLQCKISLPGSKPLVWRRFQVTDDFRLDRFHQVLIIVMGWWNSHLHEFYIADRRIGMLNDDCLDDFPDLEDETRTFLRELELQKGDEFRYLYDFGDGWDHLLKVEKVVEGATCEPQCLAGKSACPPEDCGGIGGFNDMVKMLKKPRDPEYESWIQWLPENFDPGNFDIDGVNAELAKFSRWHRKHPRAKSTPWHQL